MRKTFSNFSLASKNGSTESKSLSCSFSVPEGYSIKSVRLHVKAANAQGTSYIMKGSSTLKSWTTGTVTVNLPLVASQTIYVKFKGPSGVSDTQTRSFSSVYMDYELQENSSPCTAPSSFTTNKSSEDEAGTVTVSWSGAQEGLNNPISGYTIRANASADGNTWLPSPWPALMDASGADIGTVESTETSGSLTFNPAAAIRKVLGLNDDENVVGYSLKLAIRTDTENETMVSGWQYSSFVVKIIEEFEQQGVQLMPPYRTVHIWRRVK